MCVFCLLLRGGEIVFCYALVQFVCSTRVKYGVVCQREGGIDEIILTSETLSLRILSISSNCDHTERILLRSISDRSRVYPC